MGSMAPISGFRRFSSALSSAILEWILILLLFFDAWFSYMVTKFSRLCKLQTPCIFCSRLDHIFGSEKLGFYLDLICETHRLEISSLALCHAHGKLADVHTMCNACLFSLKPETCRSLVGNLGRHFDYSENIQYVDGDGVHARDEGDLVNVPFLKKDETNCSPVKLICSCCAAPFQHKLHVIRLLEDESIKVDVSEVDVSLSSLTGDGMRKITDKTLVSPTSDYLRNQGLNQSSHVGYSEVKVTTDSDSEVHHIHDGEGNSLAHGAENAKDDLMYQNVEPDNATDIGSSLSGSVSDNKAIGKLNYSDPVSISDNKALQKLIHSAPDNDEPSESVSEMPKSVGELHDVLEISSSTAAGHILDNSNWNQIRTNAIPPQSEFVSKDSQEVPVEDSNVKDKLEQSDAACVSTTYVDDVKDWCAKDINLGISHNASDPGQSMSNHMDMNDAYKLAVGAKGSLPSPRFADVIIGKDSSRVQEDLKLLISQISASRGLESPWHEMTPSPRVYGQDDESVLQNITKTLSLERNESGLESLDGSFVSEVEGESAFERLKRQVELDRKSISLLYKELEEERSASAIAANQAMAMITRLQEEKAAMQMEALHYQRMMEEQAEYDHEALQKCNELLTQREKEMQDLEAEMEIYRKSFTNKLPNDKAVELNGNFHDKELESCNKSRENHVVHQDSRWSNFDSLKNPLSCFEDEEAYLSNCLVKLEKKLHLFSNRGVYDDGSSLLVNDDENGFPEKTCTDIQGDDFIQRNTVSEGGVGINGWYSDKVASAGLEHLYEKDGPLEVGGILTDENLSRKPSSSFQGNHEDSFDIDKYLKGLNKNDLVALEDEVSSLSQRLEALEADRNFLEHAINSLRNGDAGVQFLQQIACDLHELRKIGITRQVHHIA
ncbi:hypothetical protein B296_00034775 [Ensete ventricosum]|uniref:GTD-binding domain-containing protein n=1 Tax=Ensete ventricosum TaxID=4639 RepID=A0A427A494_ENSVE|nr:hypothetical protein B296_00034775 [Ensete ventricosum]